MAGFSVFDDGASILSSEGPNLLTYSCQDLVGNS